MDTHYFGNQEADLACLKHLSMSTNYFFSKSTKKQVVNSQWVNLRALCMPLGGNTTVL